MSLIKQLQEQDDLVLGYRTDVRKNINARKSLFENGVFPFPKEYLSFLKEINGIKGDDARVFGIDADEKSSFNDAVVQNIKLNRQDKDKVVVLGYNVFDYLVYDSGTKEYQFRDKEDDVIVSVFGDFETSVMALLGIG